MRKRKLVPEPVGSDEGKAIGMDNQQENKMKIKKMLSQHRRDFRAIYECEHCGHEYSGTGYDDTNFHQNVIPAMKCQECGKAGADDYKPLTTKYPDGMHV